MKTSLPKNSKERKKYTYYKKEYQKEIKSSENK